MKFFSGRVIVALSVISGSLIWMFLLSNFIDEELRPEVHQELDWRLPAGAYDDNGFLILLGMNEPAENDAIEAGKHILKNELLKYYEYQQTQAKPIAADSSSTSSIFSMKESLCDYQQHANCVEYYLSQDAPTRQKLISKNKFLLDRYRAMRQSRNYVESIPPYMHALLPSFSNVLYAAKLEHAMVISEVASHHEETAVKRLLDTARFSRTLLRDGNTLISHLVALSMIKNDMRIVSELLHLYPQLARYSEPFAEMLEPISDNEYSIARDLAHERKYSLNSMNYLDVEMLKSMEQEGKEYFYDLVSLFLNKNATLNLAYDLYTLRIKVAAAEAHQFDAAVANAEKEVNKLYGASIAELLYFNNPVGKVILRVAEPSYIGYVERQHDMEGYVRLVALQYKIIAEHISAKNVAEHLKTAGLEYANPYTLAHMRWDAGRLELGFEGRQADKKDSSKRVFYAAKLPRVIARMH